MKVRNFMRGVRKVLSCMLVASMCIPSTSLFKPIKVEAATQTRITKEPVDVYMIDPHKTDDVAVFSVDAVGDNLTYEWTATGKFTTEPLGTFHGVWGYQYSSYIDNVGSYVDQSYSGFEVDARYANNIDFGLEKRISDCSFISFKYKSPINSKASLNVLLEEQYTGSSSYWYALPLTDNEWESVVIKLPSESTTYNLSFRVDFDSDTGGGTIEFKDIAFTKNKSNVSSEVVSTSRTLRIDSDSKYYKDGTTFQCKVSGANGTDTSGSATLHISNIESVYELYKVSATYTGGLVKVGSSINKDNIKVMTYFDPSNDSSHGFGLKECRTSFFECNDTVVRNIGANTITITYNLPRGVNMAHINQGNTATITVMGGDVPAVPRNVKVDEVGLDYVKISWSEPSTWNGGTTKKYKVDSKSTSSTSYTLTNLTQGTEYTVNISAVNELGESTKVPVTFTTLELDSIDTTFTGGDTFKHTEYNPSDVSVTLNYTNGTSSTTTLDTLWGSLTTQPSKIVSDVGTNTYSFEYFGKTGTFDVNGYYYDSIDATYSGESSIPVDYSHDFSTVSAVLNFTNGTSRPLSQSEFSPAGSLNVSNIGTNKFQVVFNAPEGDTTLYAEYQIEGIDWIESIDASYNGSNIYRGTNYSLDDVEVKGNYHVSDTPITLSNTDCEFNPNTVISTGDNNFTVRYLDTATNEYREDTYTVKGYEEQSIEAVYEGNNIRVDEDYNKDDVKVTVNYTDGSSKLLNSLDWSADSLTVLAEGVNTFTVTLVATFDTFISNFEVTGILVPVSFSVNYIGASSIPVDNTIYKDDIVVTVTYHNGSTRVIDSSDFTVSSLVVSDLGTNIFTVSYLDLTEQTFEVQGVDWIESITAEYTGSNIYEGLTHSLEDVIIKGNYHVSDTPIILLNSDCSMPLDTTVADGISTYTVSYLDTVKNEVRETTYTVRGYKESHLEATYTGGIVKLNDPHEKDKVKVTLWYTDNHSRVLNSDEWVAENDLVITTEGDNIFTATYNIPNKSESLTVDYIVLGGLIPVSMNITCDKPTEFGTSINKDDIKVVVTFHNGVEREIDSSAFSISPSVIDRLGDNTITVSYYDISDIVTIEGINLLKDIDIIYNGYDLIDGEDINEDDIEVWGTYSDGSRVLIPNDDWDINTGAEPNKFTITVGDITEEFEVVVHDKLIAESLVAEYLGDKVTVGNDYFKDNVKVTVTYNTRRPEVLDSTRWTANSLKVENTGVNTFTASFEGLTANYSVTGVRKQSSSSSSSSPSVPTPEPSTPLEVDVEYNGMDIVIGQSFDKSNVKVTVNYSDGTSKILDSTEWTINSLVVNEVGFNKFIGTYEDTIFEFEVRGTKPVVALYASYRGTPIRVGNIHSKNDVVVTVEYNDSTTEELDSSRWKVSGLQVTNTNENKFAVMYGGLSAEYLVYGYEGDTIPEDRNNNGIPDIYEDLEEDFDKEESDDKDSDNDKDSDSDKDSDNDKDSDSDKDSSTTNPDVSNSDSTSNDEMSSNKNPSSSQNNGIIHTGVSNSLSLLLSLALVSLGNLVLYLSTKRKRK